MQKKQEVSAWLPHTCSETELLYFLDILFLIVSFMISPFFQEIRGGSGWFDYFFIHKISFFTLQNKIY